MKNEEIIEQINNSSQETDKKEEATIEKEIKYIVFKLLQKKYAIKANLIREILLSSDIYFMPFVPKYVKGLINRHGEPYAVLSLSVLLENQEEQSNKFLILKSEEQVAFMISDIIEILKIPESNIRSLIATGEEINYFENSITIDEEEILIIDSLSILEKVNNDLH